MAQPNKKKGFLKWMFVGLFGFVGTVFIIAAVIIHWQDEKFYKTAQPVTAVITDFQRTRTRPGKPMNTVTVIEYTINEKKISNTLGYYSSPMRHGDSITVYYNPQNPLEIKSKSGGVMFFILFLAMGIVFVAISLGFYSYMRCSKRKMQWLKQHGECLQAEIIDIDTNGSISVNGSHPLIVTCRLRMPDGSEQIFKNTQVWRRKYELPESGTVPVYVDKNNPKRYYVDVDTVIQ